MKIQKNETLSLSLKIKSSFADSLSASLFTEALFENKDGIITAIPINEGNVDYVEYLKWVAEGNTADPAD